MNGSFQPAEFDCIECGRHIIDVSSETVRNPALCAACLFVPGWFRYPDVRQFIDPDHDGIGREPAGGLGSDVLRVLEPVDPRRLARRRRHRAYAKVAVGLGAMFLLFVGIIVAARAEDVPAGGVWVVDGDTVDLTGAARERIRLVGVDAPEVSHPSCPAEAAKGREAKAAAIAILRAGRTVTVTRTGRRDVYGRTLADVAIDGRDLGAALVARGLALPWRPGPAAKAERIQHWCGR